MYWERESRRELHTREIINMYIEKKKIIIENRGVSRCSCYSIEFGAILYSTSPLILSFFPFILLLLRIGVNFILFHFFFALDSRGFERVSDTGRKVGNVEEKYETDRRHFVYVYIHKIARSWHVIVAFIFQPS